MKLKKLAMCLLLTGVVGLVGCDDGSSETSSAGSSSSGTTVQNGYLDYVNNTLKDTAFEQIYDTAYQRMKEPVKEAQQIAVADPVDGTTLNMSVMYQKEDTRMKFGAKNVPYKDPNGKTYVQGDWKPTWAAIQNELNFTINDVTTTSETSIAKAFTLYQTNGFANIDIAQGSSADIVNEGNTGGNILDLAPYLDEMPDFKAFLEKNPVIRTMISTADGNIYYAPYFDGFDDIERMLMVRTDWVKDLLNGETAPTESSKTLESHYTPFYPESEDTNVTVVKADGSGSETVHKKHTKNIITIQNELATKNGTNLVKALRDYIDTTYTKADGTPYYGTNRADLFVGQNAAYDVDELIALFRVVKCFPTLLSGSADNVMWPLFPRDDTNDRVADLWRFTQFFGVRGGESRSGYLYVDDDGHIKDARGDAAMEDALFKLNQMYDEGLIFNDFTNDQATGGNEFRTYLFTNNLGFSTYDYNQTTAVLVNNDKFKENNADNPDATIESILPATAKWNGSNEYSFFTESWRSVKTEGWFITKKVADDQAKLAKALQLFNYLWTDEGNRMMSYGPDQYLEHDAEGNIVTINYQGKQVPKLSSKTLEQMLTLTNGNYTNYYRYYLGATYPSGYIKEQGMEYQTVPDKSKPGLDKVNKAIETGVLKHVDFAWNTGEKQWYNICPTTFSLTQAESNSLKNDFKELDSYINNTKGLVNNWSYIVMYGFGATQGTITTPAYDGSLKSLEELSNAD